MSLEMGEQPVHQEEMSDQQKPVRKRSVVRETKGSLGAR
jgi:hypothetical protein